ncbi:MAG: histidine kinase [Burkholderiales bacterium PBB5]|nr:MAG: histidine kinase [Burkholderiales bacterium PBB5]
MAIAAGLNPRSHRSITLQATAPTMPPPFIATAPPDVLQWVAALSERPVPLLRRTVHALDDFRDNEDAVDAHLMAQTLGTDPLFVLRLLQHVAQLRPGHSGSQAETVTEALVLLGITPFFRAFGAPLPIAELWLETQAQAHASLQGLVTRAQRAARLAMGMALQRQDHDATVIHQATLLHDLPQMLLCLQAPDLAQQLRLDADGVGGNESEAEIAALHHEVLNVSLPALRLALAQHWRLPGLLVQSCDPALAHLNQVRNVHLALRLARLSSQQGWGHPALDEPLAATAHLLGLSASQALDLLTDLDS